MNEKSPPASYYEPPAGAPDQPSDLPTRCPYCHAFLKRDWEYEEVEDEDDRRRFTRLAFWTQCKACGEKVER